MYNEKFTKLVHSLVKDPQKRKKLIKDNSIFGISCNSMEYQALMNVFSQHERIENGSIARVVPSGYWM